MPHREHDVGLNPGTLGPGTEREADAQPTRLKPTRLISGFILERQLQPDTCVCVHTPPHTHTHSVVSERFHLLCLP